MARLLKFLFFLVAIASYSQTTLPSFFGDSMVLQQQEHVAIWGFDVPDTPIQIKTTWGETSETVASSEGIWKTTLKTNKASFDRHIITIKGTTTVTIENVLVGEVWFCSGQSNMEMPLKGFKTSPVNNSGKFISTANNPNIRLFNNKRSASLLPETNANGIWEESTLASASEFSAIGYMFSKKLFDNLNIPIGIIESSWGGTRIEAWIPADSISKYPDIKIPGVLPIDENKQKLPSLLYNAMIHPFKNYTIKGILWYQGESNRTNPKPYKDYMRTLINSWRTQWNNGELPFYFVQIAPYAYNKHRSTPTINANLIREAQWQVAQEVPNTGIVITTDAGNCDDIHPPKKEIIANRLANWALAEQYQIQEIDYQSPEYSSMKIKNNKIILSFNFFSKNKKHRVFNSKTTIKSFAIAGKDRKFYPAMVEINKDQTLTIYNHMVKKPIAVRYGFVDCLDGSLFSDIGLPVSAFRTDNWD